MSSQNQFQDQRRQNDHRHQPAEVYLTFQKNTDCQNVSYTFIVMSQTIWPNNDFHLRLVYKAVMFFFY
jgi:hypothetical protein